MAFPWVVTSSGSEGSIAVCVYFMTGTSKGTAEGCFMEKPGSQGTAFIHYTMVYKVCKAYFSRLNLFLWPSSLALTSTGQVGLCFVGFYDQDQPAVVLVLKRLRDGAKAKHLI